MRLSFIGITVIGAVVWTESTACAQRRFEFPDVTRVTPAIDRGVQQARNDAEQAITQKKFVPAVKLLQSVLDHPADYFRFRDFATRRVSHSSVKARVLRDLAELPEAGRAAYELHFGPTARELFNEGLITDDVEKIAEVASRYQMTATGLEAMQWLATFLFDHDELIESALLCETMTAHPFATKELTASLLLRAAFVWHLAGQSERSVSALEALKALDLPSMWRIAGRKLSIYQDENDAPDWLVAQFGPPVSEPISTVRDWEIPRGGVRGNESATTAYPIGGSAWTISTFQYASFLLDADSNQPMQETFNRMTQQVEQTLKENNRLTQPAAIPLVIGDAVIYRTLNDVTSVNLRTGRLLWRSSVTDGMLSWMFQSSPIDSDKPITSSPTTFPGYLRHKLFRDQLCGSLSSDGKNVYAIEESETQFTPLRPRARPRFAGAFIADPANKLVAYDAKNGRLSWEVGGLSGTPPAELSGSFFLGPPLPFSGRLYCLAEVKDELCLLSLIPKETSVQLEFLQTLIALNPIDWTGWPKRRQAGLIPAIADRIMICPTANGSVVAFDLLNRQLRWGYSYENLKNRADDDERAPFGMPVRGTSFQIDEEEGRWLDGNPILQSGRVMITPRDSAEIHCLNLVDGALIWKQPRGQGLYVACINDDVVVVVERSRIVGYSLADGTEVWQEPIEIPEPSGRGVREGSKYLLPLSTGEIATIDLSAGRILGRSRLLDGKIPGNLAVGTGTLVSIGTRDITGFRSLAEIEQKIREMTTNPDNAEALALRCELRLHQGDEQKAMNDLRESFSKNPNPEVKRHLVGIMLSVFKQDSQQLLSAAEEMERLIDDPRQKIEFLRLHVRSLNDAGDKVGAIKQLFRLAELPLAADEGISNGPGDFISHERSVQSQMLTIYEAGNHDERVEIGNVMEHEFEAACAAEDKDRRLSRFVKLVLGHPAADPVLKRFVELKDGLANELEQTRLLERMSQSPDKSIAGFAVAKLASQSLAANLAREALPWIEELGQEFPFQNCLDSRTGRELCDEWLARDDVHKAKVLNFTWPAGWIDCERHQTSLARTSFPVDIISQVGRHFVGWTFEIDSTYGVLSARDASSRPAWQLQSINFVDVSRVLPSQLHIRGRRLAFSLGIWLVVMESSDSYSVPKVLFEKLLRSSSPADWRPKDIRMERHLLPTGRRFPFDNRNPAGFLIGISDESVFYQLDNRLFAADLETGRVEWSRIGPQFAKSDATIGNVLTLHTESNEALLLRPLDGAVLQHHEGSRNEKPIWFQGTRRLSHRLEDSDRQILEMRDFDGDNVVWRIQQPAGSETRIVDGNDCAVLEPSGKLTIYSLSTGQVRITTQLQVIRPNGSAGVLAVQRFEDRYVIVAGITSRSTASTNVVSLNSDTSFTVDGYASAVDCTSGHVIWSVPVEQQSFDYSQSSNVPVLVLASQQHKMDQFGRRESVLVCVLLVDKRTGRAIYETQETLLPNTRAARFIPSVEDRKLVVDFQTWNLELTFPKQEVISPK